MQLKKKAKRLLAGLLIFCMMFGMVPATGGIVAQAELENDLPGDWQLQGRSKDTSYKWVYGIGASSEGNTPLTTRFDFNIGAPYTATGVNHTDGTGLFMTTYRSAGYATWISPGTDVNGDTITPLYNHPGAVKHDMGSGNVQSITSSQSLELGNLEVRVTARPSVPEGANSTERDELAKEAQYIYIDYYVHNKDNKAKTVYIGSGADVKLTDSNNADRAICLKNDRGFFMLNEDNHSTFECITDQIPESHGVTPTNSKWVGVYHKYWNHLYDSNDEWTDGRGPGVDDSGIAYSWKLDLGAYEIAHKRVAFTIRPASYFVHPILGKDDAASGYKGTYAKPYKSIKKAVQQIRANGGVGYIYIMDDYNMGEEKDDGTQEGTINLGNGADITIESSFLNTDGSLSTTTKSLIRPGRFINKAFFYTGGSNLTLTNIILDGNKGEPLLADNEGTLIEASGSAKIILQEGTILKDNKVASAEIGSAIDMMDDVELSIKGATISGNESTGYGAINASSSQDIKLDGEIEIKTNRNHLTGDLENIYLAEGRKLEIIYNLKGEGVGVTTEDKPTRPTPTTGTTVPVAVENGEVGVYINKITSDLKNKGIYEQITTDGSNDVELARAGGNFQILYVDDAGTELSATTQGWRQSWDDLTDTAPVVANYSIDHVEFDPAEIEYFPVSDPTDPEYNPQDPNYNPIYDSSAPEYDPTAVQSGSLKVVREPFDPFGYWTITGIKGYMPQQDDIEVRFVYKTDRSRLTFDPKFGTPQPATLEGDAGTFIPAIGLPQVTKPGYDFEGWYTDPSNPATKLTVLPSTFPSTSAHYIARWTPRYDYFSDYVLKYTNADGSFVFNESTEQKSPEEILLAYKKDIPGYMIADMEDLTVDPSHYEAVDEDGDGIIDDIESANYVVGTFKPDIPDQYKFTGFMPNRNTVVKYGYQVDPSQRFNYTIKYVNNSGVEIRTADVAELNAETAIRASAPMIYGYELDKAKITAGLIGDPVAYTVGVDVENRITVEADGTFTPAAFTGRMPNQDVEITYIYKSAGIGFDFTTRYIDLDSASGDADIEEADQRIVPAGDVSNSTRKTFYGYDFDLSASDFTPVGFGDFYALSNDYEGMMPTSDLAVNFRYNRDPNKWKTITFIADTTKGSLRAGNISAEVTDQGNGTFTTSTLINDGTNEGISSAYKWADLNNRQMVPEVVANQYYMPGKWYLDVDNSGTISDGDTVITDAYQFTGPATVIASFDEDPAWWIDIYYAAGRNGTLTGPSTYHTTKDKTWGEIPAANVPVPVPDQNYLNDAWYSTGSQKTQDSELLVNGRIYEYRFKKDPTIGGADLNTPEATGSLDLDGTGRITLHDTSEGYQYIVVDQDGTIIAVKPGRNISNTVTFPDLYPGAHYDVYEVGANEVITPGNPIHSVGDKSEPQDVLIPVVEHNYLVTPDVNIDGKVTVTINPADPDSKYAILDESGGGWIIPQGNNPPIVEFPGLNPNRDYTIVAVPKDKTGVNPADKMDDGSIINTDPGVELNIPAYIVEAIRGEITEVGDTSVNASRYDKAKAGELVKLQAAPYDDMGNAFDYWKVIIGGVDGFTGEINTRDVEFHMPEANVVIAAYYKRPIATPSNAIVIDEVRGGNQNEMALNPHEVSNLEDLLTTDKDRGLIDSNGSVVTYKVVFDKNRTKTMEKQTIKASSEYDTGVEKENAFTSPWALDIKIERYVNGRRVDLATPAEASFEVIAQLEDEDIDMLDYQLFEVDKVTGDVIGLVTMNDLPEENGGVGGLFSFEGKAGSRYVMVYSKAYWVKMIIETSVQNDRKAFKVRKNYAMNHPDYRDDFRDFYENEPLAEYTDLDGVFHIYLGWSSRKIPDSFKGYQPGKPITKPTNIYAYYKNNWRRVQDYRNKLEDLPNEHSLAAEEAQDLFNQTEPRRATVEELLDAIDECMDKIEGDL